jgi:hypothetical protein
MTANRIKQPYGEGKPWFGTYVAVPTAAIIEVAALSERPWTIMTTLDADE